MPIKVRSNGLEVDGNLVPLFSGTAHYWRLDPEKWGLIFERIKDLGFSIVETYIPWSIHETAPGEFDFGRRDPAKNLDKFLSLAKEKGLKVLVRPGPHINSEISNFGYPWWILEDEKFWARDSFGGPMVLKGQAAAFKVPSYANEELLLRYEPFLAHLAPILQKHLHPHGPILAIQVDNEAGYFFRPGAYDLDYCDASIKLYRHFLELKYRQIKGLNDAYGIKAKGFDEIEAPREPQHASLKAWRPCLDWAEYKEYQLLWFLSKTAALFREKGLGSVPFYHNFYGPRTTPFCIADVEKDGGIDFCGLDSYPHKENADGCVDQARYLSSSSNLPYIPEFGAGAWPLGLKARDEVDQAACMLAPLMGGAKAVNFYMTVERERWLGSPISAEGEFHPEMAELFRRFNRFIKEEDWCKATPQNQAILLESREFQVAQAAALRPGHFNELGDFSEALWRAENGSAPFGAEVPTRDAVLKFGEQARKWLRDSFYSSSLGDSSIQPEKLKRHGAALLSSWAWLDEAFARRLRAFAEGGGQLLLGPSRPKLNQRFEALQAFADMELEAGKPLSLGDGRILWLPEFDAKAASAFLKKAKVIPEITLSEGALDLAHHRSGGRSILFLRNPTKEEKAVTVFREGKFVLKPLWSSGKFLGAVEERDVKLMPYEIRVWEVIPC